MRISCTTKDSISLNYVAAAALAALFVATTAIALQAHFDSSAWLQTSVGKARVWQLLAGANVLLVGLSILGLFVRSNTPKEKTVGKTPSPTPMKSTSQRLEIDDENASPSVRTLENQPSEDSHELDSLTRRWKEKPELLLHICNKSMQIFPSDEAAHKFIRYAQEEKPVDLREVEFPFKSGQLTLLTPDREQEEAWILANSGESLGRLTNLETGDTILVATDTAFCFSSN